MIQSLIASDVIPIHDLMLQASSCGAMPDNAGRISLDLGLSVPNFR